SQMNVQLISAAGATIGAVAKFKNSVATIANNTEWINESDLIVAHVDTAGQGQFQNLILEDPGSGTNTITLKSPTAPTTHILTLPGAPVANGQLLTDSSGLLTWAKPSLLSASHADTLAAAVVRGDLMVGNSTPAWSRFAIGAD